MCCLEKRWLRREAYGAISTVFVYVKLSEMMNLQNLGIAKQGASNGYPLPLTTGQERTLCTDERVEAFWEGCL